jgi:hypothetical protein
VLMGVLGLLKSKDYGWWIVTAFFGALVATSGLGLAGVGKGLLFGSQFRTGSATGDTFTHYWMNGCGLVMFGAMFAAFVADRPSLWTRASESSTR